MKQMRTRTARRLRRQALRHARTFGHKPALISHEGALALFGCYRCSAIMEVWDSPSIVNGSLNQEQCPGTKAGWLRRLAIKMISS
jgi:hypothetical protein